MFGYELLREKWVYLVLFGGLAFLFYIVIHYNDYYKPRKMKPENPEEYETEYMNAWQAIPWSLKVTIAAILVFAVIYSIHAIQHPNSF